MASVPVDPESAIRDSMITKKLKTESQELVKKGEVFKMLLLVKKA